MIGRANHAATQSGGSQKHGMPKDNRCNWQAAAIV
jgi:hypothetical protein